MIENKCSSNREREFFRPKLASQNKANVQDALATSDAAAVVCSVCMHPRLHRQSKTP